MISLAARTRLVSRRSTTVILFTMCLGVFIAQLDSQVVNPSRRKRPIRQRKR